MMDPIFTPMLIGTFGMSAGGAAMLSSLLTSFILAAAGVLLAVLFAPKPPKPEDGRVKIDQPIPPRQFAYGRARVTGAVMFQEVESFSTVLMVRALVDHRVNEFKQWYLNDDKVDLGGIVAGDPDKKRNVLAIDGAGTYGGDRIQLCYRYGHKNDVGFVPIQPDDIGPEIYHMVHVRFPTKWDNGAVGKGIASMCMLARDAGMDEQFTRFPNGLPTPSVVMRTAFVFDPRDSAQDPDDEETWLYSENPALHILHFYCFSAFGFARDYQRAIVPVIDDWKHAADICDEEVDVAEGGTQPRYEAGGFATASNEPKATLALMLAACDGWIVERGDGTLILRVGKFETYDVALTDDDIVAFSYQNGQSDEDVINQLNVQFTSPGHDFNEVDCDPWIWNADISRRGRIRAADYPLSWVQDYRRARRLGYRENLRNREPLRGSLVLKLSGINAAYERFVSVVSDNIPALSNRYIEIRSGRFSLADGGIIVEFIGADSDIDDWPPGGLSLEQAEGVKPPQWDEDDAVTKSGSGSGIAPLLIPTDIDAWFEPFVGNGHRVVAEWVIPTDVDPITGEALGTPPKDFALQWRRNPEDEDPGPWMRQDFLSIDRFTVGDTLQAVGWTDIVEDGPIEVRIAAMGTRGSKLEWSPRVDVIDTVLYADEDVLVDEDGDVLIY